MNNDSEQLTAEELRAAARALLTGWPTVSEYLTLVPAAMITRICDESDALEQRVAELEAGIKSALIFCGSTRDSRIAHLRDNILKPLNREGGSNE